MPRYRSSEWRLCFALNTLPINVHYQTRGHTYSTQIQNIIFKFRRHCMYHFTEVNMEMSLHSHVCVITMDHNGSVTLFTYVKTQQGQQDKPRQTRSLISSLHTDPADTGTQVSAADAIHRIKTADPYPASPGSVCREPVAPAYVLLAQVAPVMLCRAIPAGNTNVSTTNSNATTYHHLIKNIQDITHMQSSYL